MNLFKFFTLFALIVAINCKKNEYSEENQSCRQYGSGDVYPSNSNLLSDWVAAPTFSQTFRWFRDKYNLDSCLKPEIISGKKSYDFYIWIDNNEDLEFGVTKISTYEEAELICLEKLIEIVEQKEK